MKSLLVFFVLLLSATAISARKAPRDYWKEVMKNQPLPEALQGLLEANPKSSYKQKVDCHTSLQTKDSNQDFDEMPDLSIYHGDAQTNDEEPVMNDEATDGSTYDKNFEPRPSATLYHG